MSQGLREHPELFEKVIQESTDQIMHRVINRVVAEERERCAKIAERYLDMDANWSREIAEEIRKGE